MSKVSKKARPTSKTPPAAKATAQTGSVVAATVQCWSTDPQDGLPLLQESVPSLPGATLPINIVTASPQPAAAAYPPNTVEFRYWAAAVALRRTIAFWSSVGGRFDWNPAIGKTLAVGLDVGKDLNAYYSRHDGLSFFHDMVFDTNSAQMLTVYSGESPDILAHELGHAVLDALKPALWGISTTEAAGFHESFGDMSAILTALQIPAVCQEILNQTQGHIERASFVSRLGEQLGYALNLRRPGAAEADCLRNAANTWVYRDPVTLPVDGPAAVLTNAPHNFSRIFTGAFLDALSGIALVLAAAAPPTAAHLLQASKDMGRLLVRAIKNAPLRTRFFLAVAEQLLIADDKLFAGKYAKVLTTALVRHGLLALPGVTAAPVQSDSVPQLAYSVAFAAGGTSKQTGATTSNAAKSALVALDGRTLGITGHLLVEAPAIDESESDTQLPLGVFALAGATTASTRQQAIQSFVEGLALRGKIDVSEQELGVAPLLGAVQGPRVTHRIIAAPDGNVQLERLRIVCCCGSGS